MSATAKLNSRLSTDCANLQRFIDALREYLDLEPLYLRNDTSRRDAACLEALQKGPTTVAELALYTFGDCTEVSRRRVSSVLKRLKRHGRARSVHQGTWTAT